MGYCRACVPGQCSARNEVQGLAKWLLTALDFDVHTHIRACVCLCRGRAIDIDGEASDGC